MGRFVGAFIVDSRLLEDIVVSGDFDRVYSNNYYNLMKICLQTQELWIEWLTTKFPRSVLGIVSSGVNKGMFFFVNVMWSVNIDLN